MVNKTKAIITKLINSPKNAPQLITIEPKLHVAPSQGPQEINGVTSGRIILSTKDLTNAVAANPIIKAIAKAITLI